MEHLRNRLVTKVVHCKLEPYDVYIGRPSKWGNLYSHKPETKYITLKAKSVEEAVNCYREWILDPNGGGYLLKDLGELNNKVLGCWCKDKNGNGLCHGDVLKELVETGYYANCGIGYCRDNIPTIKSFLIFASLNSKKSNLFDSDYLTSHSGHAGAAFNASRAAFEQAGGP